MELVPGLTAVSDDRWAPLRTACLNAVAQLRIPVTGGAHVRGPDAPQLVVIVGGDQVTRRFDSTTAYASLLGAGVWWESGWGQAAEDPQPLPLSLSLGYWLLTASRPGYTTMTGRAPWQVLAGAAGTAAFDTRIHGSAPHNAPVISWRRQ